MYIMYIYMYIYTTNYKQYFSWKLPTNILAQAFQKFSIIFVSLCLQ